MCLFQNKVLSLLQIMPCYTKLCRTSIERSREGTARVAALVGSTVISTFYSFCDGLQSRSVLGSIDVLFMSRKVNFHVVRSALKIYSLLLKSWV